MKKKYRAFTLVEMLVVVAIIAILMLMAMIKFRNSEVSAVIRTFESNTKVLIIYAEQSYINNNGSGNIFNDLDKHTKLFKDSPKLSTYSIDKNTHILTCRLKKEAFYGSEDYVITYDVKTSEIKQTPNPLPESATLLQTP